MVTGEKGYCMIRATHGESEEMKEGGLGKAGLPCVSLQVSALVPGIMR